MRSLIQRLSLVLLFGVCATTAAAGQGAGVPRPVLGPHLGFATNNFDFLIGAQLSYQVAPRFDIYPSFEILFPNGPANAWGLNANVRYWPKLSMPNPGLYVGGGLGITHVSAGGFGDTRTGLNLLGGWEFHTPTLRPFAELRAVLASDVDRLEFVGGLNFSL